MLIAIVRANEGHESGYKLPLTPKQRLLLSTFMDVVQRECAVEGMVPALEDFLFALCEEWSPVSDGLWSCPVQCHWAARTMRIDGNFVPPEVFTQWLLKTKYLCIVTAVAHAVRHIADHPKGLIG